MILETISICLCLIRLMLRLAAPRLLTKLSDYFFLTWSAAHGSEDEGDNSGNFLLMTLAFGVDSPRAFILQAYCN